MKFADRRLQKAHHHASPPCGLDTIAATATQPGCAICKAIKNGELNAEHYQNYLKLKAESEFNEMSYVEKRKKDKAFGKFVHSVLKQKHK